MNEYIARLILEAVFACPSDLDSETLELELTKRLPGLDWHRLIEEALQEEA